MLTPKFLMGSVLFIAGFISGLLDNFYLTVCVAVIVIGSIFMLQAEQENNRKK